MLSLSLLYVIYRIKSIVFAKIFREILYKTKKNPVMPKHNGATGSFVLDFFIYRLSSCQASIRFVSRKKGEFLWLSPQWSQSRESNPLFPFCDNSAAA